MKDNIVQFPKKDEEPKMKPEDLKNLIETNQMLKYCLRIMNKIPLGDKYADGTEIKDEDLNYEELWNNVALQQKVDAGEVNGQSIAFYFQLLSTGYDNFGAMFFYNMFNSENASYLIYAIKCFIDYMSDFTDKEMNKDKE